MAEVIEDASPLFNFLFEVSRFGHPMTANGLFQSEEEAQEAGIQEINAQTILSRTQKGIFYRCNGAEILSFIELKFREGILIWYVDVDIRENLINARAYVKACYNGPPHELFVESLFEKSEDEEKNYTGVVNEAIETSLKSIRFAVKDGNYLNIHRKTSQEYPDSLYR